MVVLLKSAAYLGVRRLYQLLKDQIEGWLTAPQQLAPHQPEEDYLAALHVDWQRFHSNSASCQLQATSCLTPGEQLEQGGRDPPTPPPLPLITQLYSSIYHYL